MNVTLDGCMAGPDYELDWHFRYWDEEMSDHASLQLSNADTILMGRVTYNAMSKYWPYVINEPSYPRADIPFAEMMNNHRKIVFSGTLKSVSWNNTRLAKLNDRKKIMKLKKRAGKNIIIYGSGRVVSALMRWGLIDEYLLWIHPVVLSNGQQLFKALENDMSLELDTVKKFNSGVVLVCYHAGKNQDTSQW